jgi:phosphoglycerate dehydrogenase-like enzyme
MKVLLTKSFLSEDLDYISSHLLDGITLINPQSFDEQSLIQLVSEADVLLGSYITENLLNAATNLKFIQIPWTGVDNLDFDLLQQYNIKVCNSHSNATVVAEHAVALMMDAAKKMSYHDKLMRQGKWNRLIPGQLNVVSPFSSMISKSKVGIIGFGAVGKKIYHLLLGFDCSFEAFTKDPVNLTEYGPNLSVFSPVDMYKRMHELDIIFVAVPLTPETRNMINASFLSSMNNHAVLINISRGEIVQEEDLYHALHDKTIAFAAIDTWFNYPTRDNPEIFPSAKFEYHLLDNIVLSPHRAGYVKEAFPHLDDAIENLNRFYKGNTLKNIISLKNRY